MMLINSTVSENEPLYFVGSTHMIFFIAQAVAIHLEDSVVEILKRAGAYRHGLPTFEVRVIGYFWVLIWTCYIVPFRGPLDLQSGNEMGGHLSDTFSLVPFSLIGNLMTR